MNFNQLNVHFSNGMLKDGVNSGSTLQFFSIKRFPLKIIVTLKNKTLSHTFFNKFTFNNLRRNFSFQF